MRIISDRRKFDVVLCDRGTLDTVIRIRPVRGSHNWQYVTFDGEYAASYRDRNGAMTVRGLRELGREAAADYICPDCDAQTNEQLDKPCGAVSQ